VHEADERLTECEPVFLECALAGDQRSLRRVAARFAELARADGHEPASHDGVYLSKAYGGRSVLHGELSSLAAETVVTAIHTFTDPPSEGDERTPAARRAAALVRIAEVALAHAPEGRRSRAQVTVVVDWATLVGGRVGRQDGQFTGAIRPADVRRLLCDSNIARVVTGPDSLPLDVGRARRTVPAAMRRAVDVRDGGCVFPGCDRPPGWCEAHHVHPVADGGPTKLTNLVDLCDRHHHVVHQPGWVIRFDGRTVEVLRPDGTAVR
jgi:hypothetical protein